MEVGVVHRCNVGGGLSGEEEGGQFFHCYLAHRTSGKD